MDDNGIFSWFMALLSRDGTSLDEAPAKSGRRISPYLDAMDENCLIIVDGVRLLEAIQSMQCRLTENMLRLQEL
jgi:hypothetical protein